MVLGITGGIACGKTETGRILSSAGFQVLDSDVVAHECMAKGRSVYSALVEEFGNWMLQANGEIDRQRLGAKVFADSQTRATLNRLVHSAVMEEAKRWIEKRRAAQEDAAVLVPLLFESHWIEDWDAVLCIIAPEEQILKRLEQRGLSTQEARQRMAAQMPLAEKAARSDGVIENNVTLEILRSRVMNFVERIKHEQKEEL